MEAKNGAPVYSLHPPMVASIPDCPLTESPVQARMIWAELHPEGPDQLVSVPQTGLVEYRCTQALRASQLE